MDEQNYQDQLTTLATLRDKLKEFRTERGWQNRDVKDMALSLVLESAELLEHFQWKTGDEVVREARLKGAICDELADVLWWVLDIADRLEIDVSQAFIRKMAKNAKKYPVEVFNPNVPIEEQDRAYYKIKAATRGGHPLAED